MPFQPHIRMTALGKIGGGSIVAERFSYSLNLDNPGLEPVAFLQPNATAWNDFAEDLRAFHGSVDARICPRAVLEEVKFARIGADGKYTEDPVIVNVADTPGGDPNGTYHSFIAPQTALVASLVTDRRGPTGKGRVYLPMPVLSLTNDLSIFDGDRDQVQARFAQLVTDLGNQPGYDALDLRVCVVSSKGYNTPVTGVRVGRILDTMRSRRRSLPENYDPPTVTNQA